MYIIFGFNFKNLAKIIIRIRLLRLASDHHSIFTSSHIHTTYYDICICICSIKRYLCSDFNQHRCQYKKKIIVYIDENRFGPGYSKQRMRLIRVVHLVVLASNL